VRESKKKGRRIPEGGVVSFLMFFFFVFFCFFCFFIALSSRGGIERRKEEKQEKKEERTNGDFTPWCLFLSSFLFVFLFYLTTQNKKKETKEKKME
jgi:drug/metabolite transporter (DMT)-like permease